MSKHKHYEMGVAKLENTDLVVLVKGMQYWVESSCDFPLSEHIDYFLCLPKHKEALLNVLNGGESECKLSGGGYVSCTANKPWDRTFWYMEKCIESRIKPKKVKRWIGVYGERKTTDTFDSKDDVKTFMMLIGVKKHQLIKIEVKE